MLHKSIMYSGIFVFHVVFEYGYPSLLLQYMYYEITKFVIWMCLAWTFCLLRFMLWPL